MNLNGIYILDKNGLTLIPRFFPTMTALIFASFITGLILGIIWRSMQFIY